MVRLFSVPSCYKAQRYTAVAFSTQCNGTYTDAIHIADESFHPILQENIFSSDEEKAMPITDVFHYGGPQTLFYVDDDSDDAKIFRDAITQIDPNIKLYSVETGHALSELLTLIQPDMIFLDLYMPGKSGLECIVEIRSNLLYKALPIVVYSGTTRPSNIHTAYETGADLFLIKPFVYNELLSSLKAILLLDWDAPAKVKEQYFINNRYVAFV